MMTEYEAWLFLADAWEHKLNVNDAGLAMAMIDNIPFCGLCSAIFYLQDHELISPRTHDRMMEKIETQIGRHFFCDTNALIVPTAKWMAPKTLEGARFRFQWCKLQAQEGVAVL